jgi:hypothetical protein
MCIRTFGAVQSDHGMKMYYPASLILGNLAYSTRNTLDNFERETPSISAKFLRR